MAKKKNEATGFTGAFDRFTAGNPFRIRESGSVAGLLDIASRMPGFTADCSLGNACDRLGIEPPEIALGEWWNRADAQFRLKQAQYLIEAYNEYLTNLGLP